MTGARAAISSVVMLIVALAATAGFHPTFALTLWTAKSSTGSRVVTVDQLENHLTTVIPSGTPVTQSDPAKLTTLTVDLGTVEPGASLSNLLQLKNKDATSTTVAVSLPSAIGQITSVQVSGGSSQLLAPGATSGGVSAAVSKTIPGTGRGALRISGTGTAASGKAYSWYRDATIQATVLPAAPKSPVTASASNTSDCTTLASTSPTGPTFTDSASQSKCYKVAWAASASSFLQEYAVWRLPGTSSGSPTTCAGSGAGSTTGLGYTKIGATSASQTAFVNMVANSTPHFVYAICAMSDASHGSLSSDPMIVVL